MHAQPSHPRTEAGPLFVASQGAGPNGAPLRGSTDAGSLTKAVLNIVDIADERGARRHRRRGSIVVHGHPGTVGARYRAHREFSDPGQRASSGSLPATNRDKPRSAACRSSSSLRSCPPDAAPSPDSCAGSSPEVVTFTPKTRASDFCLLCGFSLRAFPVFDPNRCGQFLARPAQIRIVCAQFVHQVHEGVGNCIELALGGVLGARLRVLQ